MRPILELRETTAGTSQPQIRSRMGSDFAHIHSRECVQNEDLENTESQPHPSLY